jgi:hypothetical protein
VGLGAPVGKGEVVGVPDAVGYGVSVGQGEVVGYGLEATVIASLCGTIAPQLCMLPSLISSEPWIDL